MDNDKEWEYQEFMRQLSSSSCSTDKEMEITISSCDSLTKSNGNLKKSRPSKQGLTNPEHDPSGANVIKSLHEIGDSIDHDSGGFAEGLDTREEKEDKEKFFKNLKEVSSPDYDLMNKHLGTSGLLETSLGLTNLGSDKDFVEYQQPTEESLKSGSNSFSDPRSEEKSRILEAINRMSVVSSGSNCDVDAKIIKDTSAPILDDKKVTHENDFDVILGKYDQGDIENDFSKLNSPELLTSTSKYDQDVLLDKIGRGRELQRIEEDSHQLRNRNQVGDINFETKDDRGALQVKILELEGQLRHQELLLLSYQEDNKKLHQQSKVNKEISSNKDHLAQENFKLKNEVVDLRKELDRLSSQAHSKSSQKNKEISKGKDMKLEEELTSALNLISELNAEVNNLKMKLKEAAKVSGAKTMLPKKVDLGKKSLIPIFSPREYVAKKSSSSAENKDGFIDYLENKIRLLEDENRKQNEKENERFQLLQQEFINVKNQYQEHLQALERQLEQKQVVELAACSDPECSAKIHNYERTIATLKNELHTLKDKDKNNKNTTVEDVQRMQVEYNNLKKENFDLKFQMTSMRNKCEAEVKTLKSMNAAMKEDLEIQARQFEESLRQSNTKLENLNDLTETCKQLEKKVNKLKVDLKEAKKWQSPKLRPFEEINEKIHDMKERLNDRERQLKDRERQLNNPTKPFLNGERLEDSHIDLIRELETKHHEEINKWKALVLEKVNEIQYFRQQLDIVLSFVKSIKQETASSLELMSLDNSLKFPIP